MHASEDTQHSPNREAPKQSLGHKLLKLALAFLACLVAFPAAGAGAGSLVGLFTGSIASAAIAGAGIGVLAGGLLFAAITNFWSGTQGFPPGGHGGFGGGSGGGGSC